MSTGGLERAFATTRRVLENVSSDDYDKSTPCASWTVRDVVDHIVEGANWFALCVEAGTYPDPDPTHGVDYASGDVLGSYDVGVKATLAAFGAPGALEKVVTLPFGQMPGAVFLGIATTDAFTHGWDLAKATGQPTDLDRELAKLLLEQARGFVGEELRGADGEAPFGPTRDAPVGASPADQLAAFLGRTV